MLAAGAPVMDLIVVDSCSCDGSVLRLALQELHAQGGGLTQLLRLHVSQEHGLAVAAAIPDARISAQGLERSCVALRAPQRC